MTTEGYKLLLHSQSTDMYINLVVVVGEPIGQGAYGMTGPRMHAHIRTQTHVHACTYKRTHNSPCPHTKVSGLE